MLMRRTFLAVATLFALGFLPTGQALADTNLVVTVVTASDDSTPVEKAFVEVKDNKGKLRASGYTNKKGVFRWHYKGQNEGAVWEISARKAGEVALVGVSPMGRKTEVEFPLIDD